VRPPSPRHLVGTEYLAAVSRLLQRSRALHPTVGLFEAADFQWWWRSPRSTDAVPQLFWFDHVGEPEAAVILTDWGDRVALDPLVMPDAPADWVEHVMTRGLAHAAAHGFTDVTLEVARVDAALRSLLAGLGFEVVDDGVVEAWLAAPARPPISPLADGYTSTVRAAAPDGAHHMAARGGDGIEARLQQTSLYRADLDVVVTDRAGALAAYGLCWFDAATATGLVEPMRTEDAHQRRGLARHVLTAGLELLARAGADRIKICFEPGNPASSALYLDVGFVPAQQTDMFRGPTG
jgi:ribosomal protein S18 acetylase RimI-like enzyme